MVRRLSSRHAIQGLLSNGKALDPRSAHSTVTDMPELFNKLSLGSQPRTLRQRVAADVVSLLNSSARSARLRHSPAAHTRVSVLNFGNPPLLATGHSRLDPHRLAADIRAALVVFEPRFDAGSLTVRARTDTDQASGQRLYFDIQAQLCVDQSDVQLRLALDYLNNSFSLVGP